MFVGPPPPTKKVSNDCPPGPLAPTPLLSPLPPHSPLSPPPPPPLACQVNKDDLLSMVRYGAETVFSSEASTITDAGVFVFVCVCECVCARACVCVCGGGGGV